jgi:MinD superfamily P-loop ATPase
MSVEVALPVMAARSGDVPEYVVVSGKGGTGKTSVSAAFAALEPSLVLADCDVDAANCHLVLEPTVRRRTDFVAGADARVRIGDCDGCGVCADVCAYDAIRMNPDGYPEVDPLSCEGCRVCARLCPTRAIDMVPRHCGELFVSDTRRGPMVHARLGLAQESSGKLVSAVRSAARAVATDNGASAVLVDGPPGIGCPVIAAITGAAAVLVVTEPTVSGAHDLSRVLELARHFGIPAAVTVNRWDLHPAGAGRIEAAARLVGARVLSRIRFDPSVTRAQVAHTTVVEHGGGAADDIRAVWREWMKTVPAA